MPRAGKWDVSRLLYISLSFILAPEDGELQMLSQKGQEPEEGNGVDVTWKVEGVGRSRGRDCESGDAARAPTPAPPR